jgi:hypothetical protein
MMNDEDADEDVGLPVDEAPLVTDKHALPPQRAYSMNTTPTTPLTSLAA